MFAIFDTWVLESTMRPWLSRLNYYWTRVKALRKASLFRQLQVLRTAAKNRMGRWIWRSAPNTAWKETFWPEHFTPPRYRAPIALFKRPKQPIYYKNDPQLGWGGRSEGGVEIHEIGRGRLKHVQIFREPYVRELSTKLAGCMRRARERN